QREYALGLALALGGTVAAAAACVLAPGRWTPLRTSAAASGSLALLPLIAFGVQAANGRLASVGHVAWAAIVLVFLGAAAAAAESDGARGYRLAVAVAAAVAAIVWIEHAARGAGPSDTENEIVTAPLGLVVLAIAARRVRPSVAVLAA